MPHAWSTTAHSPPVPFKTHACPLVPAAHSLTPRGLPALQLGPYRAACRVPSDSGSTGRPGPRQAGSARCWKSLMREKVLVRPPLQR